MPFFAVCGVGRNGGITFYCNVLIIALNNDKMKLLFIIVL